jgi:hypothetical protein
MPGDTACGGVVDEDTLRDAAGAGCEKGRALDSSYSWIRFMMIDLLPLLTVPSVRVPMRIK